MELVTVGVRSVAVMTAIRSFTNLGLAATKTLVSSAPVVVARFPSDVQAERAQARLQDAGAVAVVVAPANRPPKPRGYRVILDDPGLNMLAVITAVRAAVGISLVEAKVLVRNAPGTVATMTDKDDADALLATLITLGAAARVEPHL